MQCSKENTIYRGRFQLGVEVPIGLITINGSSVPTAPDAAPTFDVYSSSAKIIAGKKMPPLDRYSVTGSFQYRQFVNELFTTGLYTVVYHYTVGAYVGMDIDTFEVVAGGDGSGTPIAVEFYHRPEADYLVWQTDAGRLQKGRNPAV